MLDSLLYSRIQFGANISFHILFPTISIALGWFLFYFKIQHNRTGLDCWQEAYQFWIKIFALTFALGVVSGITMSFQFGTNWPGYMETVGNIAGPLLAYEVLTAFFLEATFLGVMLFGAKRVSQRVHTLATFLVAFGTSLSAFWIIALNSWMQTPQGFTMIDGRAHAVDWMSIIFNPSMPYRLAHMLLASFLTVSFFLAGISAYRYLRNSRSPANLLVMKLALTVALVLTPIQIMLGDLHGLNTLHHQPAKLAAMEGIWNGDKIPPVAPVFFAFRVMVGIGVLMLLFSWLGRWQMRQNKPLPKLIAKGLVLMTFSGWVAVLAGWYVTEIGRQPYLVTGVLTTAQAATTLPTSMVFSTLFAYLTLYVGLLAAYIWVVFYLARQADDKENPKTHLEKKSEASWSLFRT